MSLIVTLEWFENHLSDRSFNVCCSGTKSDFVELQIRVSECVDKNASWMGDNCLKLNSEKTEVI